MNFGQFVEYKGYTGSIEYDEEDKIYFGKILNIRDLIYYHADNIFGLEQKYHEAVDDYIGISKIYSMVYDSQEYSNEGYGDYLGEFRRVKQLREDAWVDDFIGVNTETHEVCLILSREVCGYGGGIAYQVIPIPELMLRQ